MSQNAVFGVVAEGRRRCGLRGEMVLSALVTARGARVWSRWVHPLPGREKPGEGHPSGEMFILVVRLPNLMGRDGGVSWQG